MNMKNKICDCFGAELNIGDLIAYPVRNGSSMWMSFGKIINFGEVSTNIYTHHKCGKKYIELEITSTKFAKKTKHFDTEPIESKRIIKFYSLQRCVKICK